MKKILFRLPLTVLMIVFIIQTVHAETLFYEPFDYPVGPLDGNSGALGLVWTWADIWSVDPEDPSISDVVEGNLIHPDFPMVVIGNHATVSNGGTAGDLAVPFYDDGQSFWVSFLYQYVPGSSWGGWTLFFYDGATGENAAYLDLWGGYPGLRSYYTGELQRAIVDDPEEVMWVVIKAETSGSPASTEMIYMWVDPSPDNEPDITDADVALEYNIVDGTTANHLHMAGEGYPIGYRVDEIKIGTTFHDVAPSCEVALHPNPANDAINVDSTNLVLNWQPPCLDDAIYDVYLGTVPGSEPNFTDNLLVEDLSDTSFNVTEYVTFDTTYYWRVDVRIDDVNFLEGFIWTFTTASQLPVIITEPEDMTVPAGTDVQIAIEVLNDPTFTWYFSDTSDGEGIAIPDSDSSTLMISNVQQENEGYYYCVAVNDYDQSESLHVRLLAERLIAHWKFEDNLNGEVDPLNNGVPTGQISYALGIDGQAAVIDDPRYFQTTNDLGKLTEITISMWIHPDELSGQQTLLTATESTDTGTLWLRLVNHELFGEVIDGTRIGEVWLTSDQWSHCVFIYDTSTRWSGLYLNGWLMNSASAAVSPILPPLSIGANDTEERYSGLIDDLRIYNYRISDLEVASLYTAFVSEEQICLNNPIYDLSGNCQVDLEDLAFMLSEWLQCNIVPTCLP